MKSINLLRIDEQVLDIVEAELAAFKKRRDKERAETPLRACDLTFLKFVLHLSHQVADAKEGIARLAAHKEKQGYKDATQAFLQEHSNVKESRSGIPKGAKQRKHRNSAKDRAKVAEEAVVLSAEDGAVAATG